MKNLKEFLNSVIIVDFETTGEDPKTAEIIEIGTAEYSETHWHGWSSQGMLIKPTSPIPPMASSINGISNKMVEDSLDLGSVRQAYLEIFSTHKALVAHNAKYEQDIMKTYFAECTTPWICTYRLAKLAHNGDSTVESYAQNYLRYRLNLPVDDLITPHRAANDCLITAALLENLIKDLWLQGKIDENACLLTQLLEIQKKPIITKVMPFGKHKGELLTKVPKSYWQWALTNMDALNENSSNYDPDFAASVIEALSDI